MPATLKAFLAANPVVHKADLFAITLPTGTVMFVTDGQWDITVTSLTPGWGNATTTFRAQQYGNWHRGDITSEASFALSANTMDLTVIAQPDTMYPGLNIGILNAILNHLLDGCLVWVYTAYMPLGQYGNVSVGIETKWQGTISKWDPLGRNSVKLECADPMYLLNIKVPSRLFMSNCPWSFADARCSLSAANYTTTFTAGAGSTQSSLVSGMAIADGYFTQGVVTCTAGQNKGLSQTVKSYASGAVVSMAPWLLPVEQGDAFSIIKGCDKTPATCEATAHINGQLETQEWYVRFGGDPFIPPPATAV